MCLNKFICYLNILCYIEKKYFIIIISFFNQNISIMKVKFFYSILVLALFGTTFLALSDNDNIAYNAAHCPELAENNVLGLPDHIVSDDLMYSPIESYTTTVEIGETQGYSDALAPYFDKVPVQLLFDGIYKESDMDYVAAGEHKDCINWCKENKKKGDGRGKCKFNCWVDTAVKIIEAIF